MSRIIALALVFGGIWWAWRRWQQAALAEQQEKTKQRPPQRLSQCVRCDAMLPSNSAQRQEVANHCEHGERCPLRQQP